MVETVTDAEVIEAAGLKVPIDREVLTQPIIETMLAGKYENARVKCLAQMVAPGDRIIDVGGGIGFTAALMGRGRPELIVSIDGHPRVQAYAARLQALNGVQAVNRQALVVTVKTAETASFYISRHFWGSSMLPGVKAQTEVVTAPVLSFGDLIAEYRPNMLVIDLEVMREYLSPDAASGPIEAMDLTGVSKVAAHLPPSIAPPAAIKRVFDFFSGQGFHYDTDHSRGPVVLFRRIAS